MYAPTDAFIIGGIKKRLLIPEWERISLDRVGGNG
jgi:hypothetical protein